MRTTAALIVTLAALTACGDKQQPVKIEAPAKLAPDTPPSPPAPAASKPAPRPDTGASVDNGRLKYATVCLSCHGQAGKGQGPFPKLAGKPAAEVAAKLKDYRAGKQLGPQSVTMMPFAKPLTDTEIDALADYLSTL
jgi:cytochrome c553